MCKIASHFSPSLPLPKQIHWLLVTLAVLCSDNFCTSTFIMLDLTIWLVKIQMLQKGLLLLTFSCVAGLHLLSQLFHQFWVCLLHLLGQLLASTTFTSYTVLSSVSQSYVLLISKQHVHVIRCRSEIVFSLPQYKYTTQYTDCEITINSDCYCSHFNIHNALLISQVENWYIRNEGYLIKMSSLSQNLLNSAFRSQRICKLPTQQPKTWNYYNETTANVNCVDQCVIREPNLHLQ